MPAGISLERRVILGVQYLATRKIPEELKPLIRAVLDNAGNTRRIADRYRIRLYFYLQNAGLIGRGLVASAIRR